jgi:AraC-like DNA-binding protein
VKEELAESLSHYIDALERLAGILSEQDEQASLLETLQEMRKECHDLLQMIEQSMRTLHQGQSFSANSDKFLENIRSLTLRYMAHEAFGPEWVADRLSISRSQLDRKVKEFSGQTTALFLRSIRLEHARNLILEETWQISEIAYRCGYPNPATFSTEFKKAFGISPSALRNK